MVEKVERLRTRVEKVKMGTRIRNEAPMNDFNCSTAQPLNNSTAQQFNKLASHPPNKTPIIQVKHLSKRYQIGMDRTYKTFCESAVDTIKSPLKRLKSFSRQEETFWALKDINFEVFPGEVVGIIGRNGAGNLGPRCSRSFRVLRIQPKAK